MVTPSSPVPSPAQILVEFPGIVVNEDKALAALGGEEGVAGVVATPGTMLPLKFRYPSTMPQTLSPKL